MLFTEIPLPSVPSVGGKYHNIVHSLTLTLSPRFPLTSSSLSTLNCSMDDYLRRGIIACCLSKLDWQFFTDKSGSSWPINAFTWPVSCKDEWMHGSQLSLTGPTPLPFTWLWAFDTYFQIGCSPPYGDPVDAQGQHPARPLYTPLTLTLAFVICLPYRVRRMFLTPMPESSIQSTVRVQGSFPQITEGKNRMLVLQIKSPTTQDTFPRNPNILSAQLFLSPICK